MLSRQQPYLRLQDVVWLLFFAALAAVSPTLNDAEVEILCGLALIQVLEPRFAALRTPRGRIAAIALKLLLGYLLIGVSGGLTSSYYLILLVPVVAAATTFGAIGAALVTLAAGASYLSFLFFVDWNRLTILPDDARELALRVLFLCLTSYLTFQLVEANRTQTRNYLSVAEQLAAANRNLRLAEAAVRRSERLAALGQLTAGLAHELRNPLGTMKASAEVLSRNLPPDVDVARELAGFITAEVDRLNDLITRFLDFARPVKLERTPVEIAEVIDRAVEQLSRHHPPFDITVYRNDSPDVRPLPMDRALMESAIYNLLENAAQASPPGGVITVKTRPVKGGVEVSVIDRGSGIPPEDRESIFNPFFTTKPYGIGLGLAVVAKIVDEHGGKMAVESEPGQGSVFRVVLPAGTAE
jgi:signal transduction histidine kinase